MGGKEGKSRLALGSGKRVYLSLLNLVLLFHCVFCSRSLSIYSSKKKTSVSYFFCLSIFEIFQFGRFIWPQFLSTASCTSYSFLRNRVLFFPTLKPFTSAKLAPHSLFVNLLKFTPQIGSKLDQTTVPVAFTGCTRSTTH